MTLYPIGYGTELVTLDALRARHEPRMHPDFADALFPALESQDGFMGIGGGWRAGGTQPDKPGFAQEGKSFHQNQQFRSGIVGYAAVDLVVRNGSNVHRSPTWAETEFFPAFELHTFITGEPWHVQPGNIRGWQTWVNHGRPDPTRYTPPLPPPDPSPTEEVDMIYVNYKPNTPSWTAFVWTGTELAWAENGNAVAVLKRGNVSEVTVTNDDELLGVILASRTVTRCPHTLTGTLKAQWESKAA